MTDEIDDFISEGAPTNDPGFLFEIVKVPAGKWKSVRGVSLFQVSFSEALVSINSLTGELKLQKNVTWSVRSGK